MLAKNTGKNKEFISANQEGCLSQEAVAVYDRLLQFDEDLQKIAGTYDIEIKFINPDVPSKVITHDLNRCITQDFRGLVIALHNAIAFLEYAPDNALIVELQLALDIFH